MSKVLSTIELRPPQLIAFNNREEFQRSGFRCPVCSGNGHHIEYISRKESEFRECPVCRGRGQLKATIFIEWSPEDTPTEEELNTEYTLAR